MSWPMEGGRGFRLKFFSSREQGDRDGAIHAQHIRGVGLVEHREGQRGGQKPRVAEGLRGSRLVPGAVAQTGGVQRGSERGKAEQR